MPEQTITSREYKVMLKPEKFLGSEKELLKQAKDFWQIFSNSIQDIVFDTDGNLDEIKEKRTIRFYDTAEHLLYNSGYIFRERTDQKREVALKFRHSDRYISQDRDMSAKIVEKGKTKFEEDIKLPFISLYSFSTKQTISMDKSFKKLGAIAELYPDLKKKLTTCQKEQTLHLVGNFAAREIVIEGADFEISEDPNKIEADCALIVWYNAVVNDKPEVAEFSFKYKNKKGEYDGKMAKIAYDVFHKLTNGLLTDWVNPDGLTKTKYVYSLE